MRYTASGAEYVSFDIPQEYIDKYSTCDTSSLTKRTLFWRSSQMKTDWGCHLVGKLLTDSEFVNVLAEQMNSSTYKWFSKSFNKFTTNFYVFFSDLEAPEATPEAKTPKAKAKAPKAPVKAPKAKKESKKREPKPIDPLKEARKVYKTAKIRLNNKVKLLKTLNNWKDPYSLENRGDQNTRERADVVLKNIFAAYKTYFEEGLAAKGIPFYINKEGFDLNNTYRNRGAQIYAEYVFVNNTENVPTEVMDKQNFQVLTVTWCVSRKLRNSSTYYRDYERVMSIDKIGIVYNKTHEYIRRGLVKSFKSLREVTLTEMVEKVFNTNNTMYASKIDDFKSLQSRIAQNQVEENKLKDFLTKNIIAVLNPTYLKNSALDLEENQFEVAVPLPKQGWSISEIDILNVQKKTDYLENLTIRLTFFGAKTKEVNTAADAILAIDTVFRNEIVKTIDIISRTSII